jgi:hypothetical protein
MASVAGAGNGKRPCAQRIQPVPSTTGEASTRGLPSSSKADARAHDVHDGIHRADFVEMHFARRFAVDLALGVRDALKHRDGFPFHPRRQLALGDEFFDVVEIPAVVVRMVVAPCS